MDEGLRFAYGEGGLAWQPAQQVLCCSYNHRLITELLNVEKRSLRRPFLFEFGKSVRTMTLTVELICRPPTLNGRRSTFRLS
ncbi:hypothetical protein PALB_1770 [Pseudoalteromonas luteoviolacea B = ATCC 29581]|nr:hypothetical protein PALB_1770 [Pseudoalteromonas luteoviolacea B = ATCC 29581]